MREIIVNKISDVVDGNKPLESNGRDALRIQIIKSGLYQELYAKHLASVKKESDNNV